MLPKSKESNTDEIAINDRSDKDNSYIEHEQLKEGLVFLLFFFKADNTELYLEFLI